MLAAIAILAVWLAVGGFRDMAALYRTLRAVRLDANDDGMVQTADREEPGR